MNQYKTAAFENLQSVPTASAPSAAARTVAVMDLTDDCATSDDATAAAQRTTAAGLEAWMAGHREHPEPEPGPVNVAEALMLEPPATAIRVTDPDGNQLVVDPERNAYYFASTSLKPMTALLQQSAAALQPVYSAALSAAREGAVTQPLPRLLWFAGLVATPGILARRLGRDERYRLTRWPETEREFPKHFRIAKAMMKDPVTPAKIASAAGVPLEDVIDYINASFAAGRLEAVSELPPVEEAPAPRRNGLMAMLNKPLFAR